MIGLVKQAVIYGGALALLVGLIFFIRLIIYRIGMKSMSRRAYSMASFFFTITGFPFLMENARVYRRYCHFRMGKISYEKVRQTIEDSKMAYRNDGYALLKKVNQVQNRSNKSGVTSQ